MWKLLHKGIPMANKTIIHQIYFDDKTKGFLNPVAIPIDNSWYDGKPLQPAFENHIIQNVIKYDYDLDCDYIGVLSWQFETKNSYRLSKIHDDIEKYPNYDIYSFYKAHTQPNIWRVAEGWHKGIIETAQYIFDRFIPIKITTLNTPIIYQNAHVSKIELYKDYVNNWLNPLMEIMFDQEDKKLQEMLWIDTKYKSWSLNRDKVTQITGVPYYPMHTFICERFFSTYCAVNNPKIKQLC